MEETISSSVEERVLFFLGTVQPDHAITSVNQALQPLHCSRRQLQRVLKKLCDGGRVVKTGRGCYRLAGPQTTTGKKGMEHADCHSR